MSNRVVIIPTEFKDVRTNETYYGARIADSYAKSYDNTWGFIPDDDMEVIKRMMEDEDETIVNIFYYVKEHGIGIYVSEKYYSWEQIKHLFKDYNPPE